MSAVTLFSLSSCQKLKDALFEPFESPITFDVTIPVVTNTSTEIALGETSVRFNLDSVIRANTGNVFGADIVGNMQIKEIGIEIVDGNATSNLSNFSYVKLAITAGNTAPAVLGPFNIPPSATASAAFQVNSSVNVKNMFSGATTNFQIIGRARTPTTMPMKARVSTIIGFEK